MARRHARRGQRLWALVLVALLALTGCAAPQQRAALREAAPDAPDAPGASEAAESRWTTGAKQGVGTSTSLASKVWFTLGEGITHEVYYPQLDVPNVQDLQLIVTDGSSLFHPERDATTHEVKLPDPRALTYQQVNES
ncbi:MAG: glucoamylase, partial [Egibacteraceae bacterium]